MKKTKAQGPGETLFTFFNEVGIISQLSSTLFERQLPQGLTNSQFSVLNWFFRVDNEATPTRLATAFQVTGGAMTNTLKKLEAKGLVKIAPDAHSGRQKKVTITKQGRAMRDKAIAGAAPLLMEFAAEFSPANIEKLTRQLQKVRAYLDASRYENKADK